jgi:hypothetical protein
MATPSVYEMSNKNGSDSLLSASKGSFVINNTVEKTLQCRAIVVLEDTVFTSIKELGAVTDVKANYIAAVGTAIKAGSIITPFSNKKFEKIKLASGSVILVL